jgi:hypothetical protein
LFFLPRFLNPSFRLLSAGAALMALQRFVTVVATYFPARPAVEAWLADLHAWIHRHEDAIRGEDLSAWLATSYSPRGIQVGD